MGVLSKLVKQAIIEKVNEKIDKVKIKAAELDTQHHVSEKVLEGAEKVTDKVAMGLMRVKKKIVQLQNR